VSLRLRVVPAAEVNELKDYVCVMRKGPNGDLPMRAVLEEMTGQIAVTVGGQIEFVWAEVPISLPVQEGH
jgi:hypothetical protein